MTDNRERASAFLENIDTSMFSEDELIRQEHVVEAILFMMGDSVPVDDIAIALECEHDIALAAAERLVIKYENEYKERGMKVIRINHKYQMVANNQYFKNLVLIASKPQKPVLSDAVLETLSIIAYKQPITKPEIEDIRSVKSDFAVNRLIEYGLVEEKGRLDAPGRPIILGTTEEFLLRFGLESTEDLPELPAFKEAAIRHEVEKEVGESFNQTIRLTEDGKIDEGENNIINTPSENTNNQENYDNQVDQTNQADQANQGNQDSQNDQNKQDNENILDENNNELENQITTEQNEEIDLNQNINSESETETTFDAKKSDDEKIETVDIKEYETKQDKDYDTDYKYNEVEKEENKINYNTNDNLVEPDINTGDMETASFEFTHERHDNQHDEKDDTDDKEPQ